MITKNPARPPEAPFRLLIRFFDMHVWDRSANFCRTPQVVLTKLMPLMIISARVSWLAGLAVVAGGLETDDVSLGDQTLGTELRCFDEP